MSAKPKKPRPSRRNGHVVKKPASIIDLGQDVPDETRLSLVLVREGFKVMMAVVFLAGVVAILRWGVTPIAHEIADTDTSMTFNGALQASTGLNVAFAVTFSWREWSRRSLRKELNALEAKRGGKRPKRR